MSQPGAGDQLSWLKDHLKLTAWRPARESGYRLPLRLFFTRRRIWIGFSGRKVLRRGRACTLAEGKAATVLHQHARGRASRTLCNSSLRS